MMQKSPKNKRNIIKNQDDKFNSLRNEIFSMNYEQSLKELDDILNSLQKDNIPLDDLQKSYIKGNLLLQRCQSLLDNLEQDVSEINIDSLLDSN